MNVAAIASDDVNVDNDDAMNKSTNHKKNQSLYPNDDCLYAPPPPSMWPTCCTMANDVVAGSACDANETR